MATDDSYLLAKMEGAFHLREGRGMTDRERRFAIASAHDAADECHATCDVSRMRSLLREQPSLLDTVGSLALSMATTYHGTHDAVVFLLDRGVRTLYDCETGLAGKGNHEAVSGAFYCGNFRTLRTLFEAGVTDASFANMPWISWPHKTTLLRMSIYRPLEYARFALEHGVDPDEELPFEEESGRTALQNAVAPPVGGAGLPWHNPERWAQGMRFAEFLLSEGAYYDVFSACGRGDLDRLRTLTAEDRGVIETRGAADLTPLHWAVRGRSLDCARWLLDRGADANAESLSGRTALHIAAEWGLDDMVWLLAGYGADLNPRDTKGRTPLHRATYLGEVEAAEALIVLGAGTRLRTRAGKTAIELARLGCKYLRQG